MVNIFLKKDNMETLIFNNIKDILIEIKNKNYDRNYASIIGFEFAFDESNNLIFNNLDDYSFFFYYLDVEQFNFSDEKFKYTIDKLLLLMEVNPIEVKKILYEDQLKEIEEKYSGKVISEETYYRLKNKYLS